jgi:imidazolonepropionase-like amidohydrolase
LTRVVAGVRLWNGHSARADEGPLAIRIEGDRIAAIGREAELAAGASVLSFPGCTALPGLIDAHVHVELDPAGPPPELQAAAPAQRVLAEMERRARAMLAAGVTTARDLGGRDWLALELRERIASGLVEGPRLVCAGQPITSRGGHTHFWGGEAAGVAGIRAVVRRQIERGADWIKVMATGGMLTPGTQVAQAQFSKAELAALVEAAAERGRFVAAHCHGTEGIRRAAGARVRTVEHCSFAGDQGFGSDLDLRAVDALAGSGAWVSPTINAGWRRFLGGEGERGRFGERMGACLAALRAAGVPLVASTDAGIPRVEHHRLAEALAVMAALGGMSPVEALRAATSESARALGLEAETGALRPGLAADVLVVEGDPLADLGALLAPRLVIARGRPLEPLAARPAAAT